MSIETSKSEKFLQLNDIDNGVVIFSSYINLKCLCDVDDVFMDGTFKCCPKYFQQFCTLQERKLRSVSLYVVARKIRSRISVCFFQFDQDMQRERVGVSI
jgi:hypothetical protein